jgi:dolichol-phosphate mannosyltransferase
MIEAVLAPADNWQLPEFSVTQFRPRRSAYCVCVFVLNEDQRIATQLRRMEPFSDVVDIVIADGGSTDGALEPGFLADQGVTALLVKRSSGKLGTQMRMAFAWAMQQGYEGVITIDGNNKDGPEAIPAFVAALQAGIDHVQGSRFIDGGVSKNLPFGRWLGVRLIHAPLLSIAAGFHYTDTTNGFRGYSRRLLTDSQVAVFRDVFVGYELHYYLAIRAARLGFQVAEIPVARCYPAHGPVPTKISPVRGNLRVLRCLFQACLGGFKPVRTTGEKDATDG